MLASTFPNANVSMVPSGLVFMARSGERGQTGLASLLLIIVNTARKFINVPFADIDKSTI